MYNTGGRRARVSPLIQNEFSDDDAFVTNALLCRRIRTARFDVRRMEDDNSWRLVASAVASNTVVRSVVNAVFLLIVCKK